MDYCSTCRRHLNGALVCPGCGAYAPDIAPPTAGRTGAQPATTAGAPAANAVRDPSASDTWHGPLPGGEADRAGWDAAPHSDSSADVGDVPVVREGRAARRRQLARWKKNKRRAAVATAVAIVGGGLTVTAMDRQAPDRARAATAPDQQTMGAAEEQMPVYGRPAPTPSTPHRSAVTSEAGSAASGTSRQQPPAAPPRIKAPLTQPDAAAPPAPVATSAPRPQHTASSSSGESGHDSTGSTAGQPSAPVPAESTDPGTSPTDPAPASTSPTEVCLLVLCLG
jgi:hypothetical protein